MFLPSTYTTSDIDLAILPNAIYGAILAKDVTAITAYVVANPAIIQQLSFLNRAFRTANNYSSNGGCGNIFNIPYLCKYGADNSTTWVTLSNTQCRKMFRYIATGGMMNSNLFFLMKVAFSIANQLQTAKRTIVNSGQVCINCDLLQLIQNPQYAATNDNARVLNEMIKAKGATCVSGSLINLNCS